MITKNTAVEIRSKPKDPDEELVLRMQRGEAEAFVEMVERYQQRLYRSMYAFTNNPQMAEEIVQDAFTKVFQHVASFQNRSRFSTWLFRIAWNVAVSRLRKTSREVSLDDTQKGVGAAPACFNPNARIEREEKIHVVREAIQCLESHHQQVLLLREFDELSYQEIADVLNVSAGTVRSRLSRARSRLKNVLSAPSLAAVIGESD